MKVRLDLLRRWPGFSVVAVFVLALVVRLWELTYHSLWFDEAVSVFWASQPVERIWSVGTSLVEDKHPPLYHLLLHGWMSFFGPSDGAVRSLGSLLGAAAVLPAYGMGRLLGDRRAGIVAGLLVALNAFLVWYSQEARMFMPATTMGLVGLFGLLKAWDSCLVSQRAGPGRPRISCVGWLAVGLVGLVSACYTYLFGLFFLIVAGLWLLALLGVAELADPSARPWSAFAACASMLVAATMLVAPLLWSAWQVNARESVPGHAFAAFGTVIRNLLNAFSVHKGPWRTWISGSAWIASGALACVGMAVPLRHESMETRLALAGRPCLALYLVAPLVIGGALLSRDGSLFDEPRYFIIVVPALCLLWGRALAMLLQRIRWVGAGLLTIALGVSLVGVGHSWTPGNLREDWRTAAQYVESHAGSNDAVLVHVGYVNVAFRRYFEGPQPVFFPFTDHLEDSSEVDAPLTGMQVHDSVWLVQSHTEQFDPNHLVERWFTDRFPLAAEQYPSGVTLKRFLTRYRLDALPEHVPRVSAPFGDDVSLVGCWVAEMSTPAVDVRSHPPSAWIHVTLYWQASARPGADYSSFVRMVDELGQVWGDRLQRERETLRVWPTSRWEPGEVVRDEVDVNLNPVTPAGRYRIVVGLVDEGGAALGEGFICSEVDVTG